MRPSETQLYSATGSAAPQADATPAGTIHERAGTPVSAVQ